MGGFPSPATTYEKSRRSDAVPDILAPASSLSMSDSQDAEYGETTTWARWRSFTSAYPVEAMVRLRAPTKFSEPSARVEGP